MKAVFEAYERYLEAVKNSKPSFGPIRPLSDVETAQVAVFDAVHNYYNSVKEAERKREEAITKVPVLGFPADKLDKLNELAAIHTRFSAGQIMDYVFCRGVEAERVLQALLDAGVAEKKRIPLSNPRTGWSGEAEYHVLIVEQVRFVIPE